MQRLLPVLVALVALAAPADARAALFFVFDHADAAPNERVVVRIGGTPAGFQPRQRVKPVQRPVRLYLVRADQAAEVHSRLDPRLHFVGSVVPDANVRGLLGFNLPPLDPSSTRSPTGAPAAPRSVADERSSCSGPASSRSHTAHRDFCASAPT